MSSSRSAGDKIRRGNLFDAALDRTNLLATPTLMKLSTCCCCFCVRSETSIALSLLSALLLLPLTTKSRSSSCSTYFSTRVMIWKPGGYIGPGKLVVGSVDAFHSCSSVSNVSSTLHRHCDAILAAVAALTKVGGLPR